MGFLTNLGAFLKNLAQKGVGVYTLELSSSHKYDHGSTVMKVYLVIVTFDEYSNETFDEYSNETFDELTSTVMKPLTSTAMKPLTS